MPEQTNKPPHQQPLASLETDLFETLFAFHQKTVTLLRQSLLDDEKRAIVMDRIKTLLGNASADVKGMRQINLAECLEAAFDEVSRLVDELSSSLDDHKKG